MHVHHVVLVTAFVRRNIYDAISIWIPSAKHTQYKVVNIQIGYTGCQGH